MAMIAGGLTTFTRAHFALTRDLPLAPLAFRQFYLVAALFVTITSIVDATVRQRPKESHKATVTMP